MWTKFGPVGSNAHFPITKNIYIFDNQGGKHDKSSVGEDEEVKDKKPIRGSVLIKMKLRQHGNNISFSKET